MKISQNGIDLIKQFEGFRADAYKDQAGVWTIGYGSTFYKDNTKVQKGDSITEPEALELFLDMLKDYENAVSNNVTASLNQNEFDALVSFVYNVGQGNFAKSTLLRLLNEGKVSRQVVAEEFKKWNKAGGKVSNGLTNRRAAEYNLFLKE